MFFTVAAKEGSTNGLHLDWHDKKQTVSWVVPLGDFDGAESCIPQLGYWIPLQPGQILAVPTCLLIHCGLPATRGRHVILALFADKFLFNLQQSI